MLVKKKFFTQMKPTAMAALILIKLTIQLIKLDKHNPKKIIYNANVNDALDIFLRYKYNPFHNAVDKKLYPISINRIADAFNTMVFCERNDVYCALCNTLKDMRGLLFLYPLQQQQLHSYDRNRYQFNQQSSHQPLMYQ